MNVFVDRIDELLKNKGLNRNDLNNAIDLQKNTIAQWKIRETIPSADIAVKIAQFLNTSVEYLVTGEEKKDNSKIILSDLQELIARYS